MQILYKEFEGKEYLEQWERVGRWYKKLMLVKHGYYKEYSDRELLDILYAYFMNIQHLKDWVKNSTKNLENKLANLEKETCLIVCADFINNHKHLIRKNGAKSIDKESSVKHQHVKVSCQPIRFSTTESGAIEDDAIKRLYEKYSINSIYRWEILHVGNKYDTYDLAKDCYETWLSFLKNNSLVS